MIYNVARGALTEASSTEMLTTLVGDIGDVLVGGLTVILALMAVLIGLFFVLRFVMRRIGRSR